jgi:hypothetical protein
MNDKSQRRASQNIKELKPFVVLYKDSKLADDLHCPMFLYRNKFAYQDQYIT